MNTYVCDTHSLVWYLMDDKRLSPKALRVFETDVDGRIIVPIIVLAELMYIAEKGRVTVSFRDTLDVIEQCEDVHTVPRDREVLKAAEAVDAGLEMHDRLIVATAKVYDAILITCDTQITESGSVPTLW